MPHNPVGWFEIYVDDMKRARRFYEKVLEVELTNLDVPKGWPDLAMMGFPMEPGASGAAGALVKMKGFEPGPGGVLVYFTCRDCALEADRVTEAGGKIHRMKTSIGDHGFIALAEDTEGNMFGLHSR